MKIRGERLAEQGVRRTGARAPVVAGAVVALVAVPLGFAGPAAAEQPYLEHYTDHDEQFLPAGTCTSFPIGFTHDGTGTLRFVRHGDAQYYQVDTFNDTNVFTNLDNGNTFTLSAHGVDKDVRVTDDGTGVLTIQAHESGSFSYRGPDGRLVVHDAGTFPYTLVLDTKGTPDPDDDEELSFTPGPAHGINQSADHDLCDDLAGILG